MIDILLNGIMLCLIIPDFNEFSMCIDNVVLEYNLMIEWEKTNI